MAQEFSTAIKFDLIDNFSANAQKVSANANKMGENLKNVGEIGGKVDEMGKASMKAAQSFGAMQGAASQMGGAIGDVGDMASKLLSNGFNPMGLAIAGLAVAVPILVTAFLNFKDSIQTINQRFDSFKEKMQGAKQEIFDISDKMKEFRYINLSLAGDLGRTAQAYQGVLAQQKAVSEAVKNYSTKDAVLEAKRFIEVFNNAWSQQGKVFDALKLDEVSGRLNDMSRQISATKAQWGSKDKDLLEILDIPKYQSAINTVFSSNDVAAYFQKAKLAGQDFGTSYWQILKKVFGFEDEYIQKIRKERPEMYNEWWNKAQAFYQQKETKENLDVQRQIQKSKEAAQARSDANKQALDSTVAYYKSIMDSGDFYFSKAKWLDQSLYAQKHGYEKSHSDYAKKNYDLLLFAQYEYEIKSIKNSKASFSEKEQMSQLAKQNYIKDLEEMLNKEAKMQGKTSVFEVSLDPKTMKAMNKELNIHEQTLKRISRQKPFDAFDGLNDKIDLLGELNNKLITVNDMMANTVMSTLGTMGQAFSDMFESITSGADFSMSKYVYTITKGLSIQAMQQALYFTAMGIAASTPWGAASLGNPANFFAAAAVFAGIGAGAGLAAGLMTPGKGDSGGSSGSGGGSSSIKETKETVTSGVTLNVYGSMYKDRMAEVEDNMRYLGKKLSART